MGACVPAAGRKVLLQQLARHASADSLKKAPLPAGLLYLAHHCWARPAYAAEQAAAVDHRHAQGVLLSTKWSAVWVHLVAYKTSQHNLRHSRLMGLMHLAVGGRCSLGHQYTNACGGSCVSCRTISLPQSAHTAACFLHLSQGPSRHSREASPTAQGLGFRVKLAPDTAWYWLPDAAARPPDFLPRRCCCGGLSRPVPAETRHLGQPHDTGSPGASVTATFCPIWT